MPKRWRLAPFDPARVASLERSAGVPAVVAQLLLARGIEDPEAVRQFLDPKLTGLRDPASLPGLTAAADLIFEAVRSGRPIAVYGDYDADGMASTAILSRCLRLLGAKAELYVPHRLEEGYGLNEEALRKFAGQGIELVVTVDCGVASVAEARIARELGLTLVVTDHHQFADELPDAAAIVHPALPGGGYPFHGLCGAAVALKLAWALCQRASGAARVSERYREFLLQAVGVAAIGTVSDVAPLVDENRILVRQGLQLLRTHPTPGVAALASRTGLADKPRWDAEDLAFVLGPRLNAAGRLGQAEIGVELLTTDNSARADQLAQYLDELNQQRQTLERSISLAAEKQLRQRFDAPHDPALVVADHDWHPGIIGIVAGRLADKHQAPTIVVALDKLGVRPGVGSARSVPGFNVHAALQECRDLLETCGGHAAAAGLRIVEANLPAFRRRFSDIVRRELGSEARGAELRVDAEAPLATLTRRTIEQMESLAPFGHGNARPLFCASNVRVATPPKRIGGGGRHLSVTLDQAGVRMRGVAFGGGDWCDELAETAGEIAIAFHPVLNRYQGRTNVEVHLTDWRREEERSPGVDLEQP